MEVLPLDRSARAPEPAQPQREWSGTLVARWVDRGLTDLQSHRPNATRTWVRAPMEGLIHRSDAVGASQMGRATCGMQ